MEYRFSVTARLVALGACGLIALMVLLFVLGVIVGGRLATTPRHQVPAPAAGMVTETAPVVEGEPK